MATRSSIGILEENGSIYAVYVHFDGYPEGVGATLLDHYQDPVKIRELIALGNMSCLGDAVHPSGPHSYNNPQANVTVFYGRDRNETDQEPRYFQDRQDYLTNFDSGEEYQYLWNGVQWECSSDNRTWSTVAFLLNRKPVNLPYGVEADRETVTAICQFLIDIGQDDIRKQVEQTFGNMK